MSDWQTRRPHFGGFSRSPDWRLPRWQSHPRVGQIRGVQEEENTVDCLRIPIKGLAKAWISGPALTALFKQSSEET